ncbi:hypothetical protein [Deinococcus humi]|uniref:Uncharacterized protein n=1 Tax=Deinococcus humi TaxID=662880 RepID=A0A7W8JZJ5_9DEIO|nr:hypothetical protein [Deinococcus humi]MBB5366111.1 hypothetical protein [Deinococcus humi]GGO42004.1 hypothetical protein GCM10008949_53570 [Deinococcus humi]
MGLHSLTDLTALEPFSFGFALALFARYPLWAQDAQIDPEERTLFLRIQASESSGSELCLETWADQVVVVFEGWHGQYGWIDNQKVYAEAISLIDEVVEQNYGARQFMLGSTLVRSEFVERSTPLVAEEQARSRAGHWAFRQYLYKNTRDTIPEGREGNEGPSPLGVVEGPSVKPDVGPSVFAKTTWGSRSHLDPVEE